MDEKHGLHEGIRMDSMKEIKILIQMGGKFMDFDEGKWQDWNEELDEGR